MLLGHYYLFGMAVTRPTSSHQLIVLYPKIASLRRFKKAFSIRLVELRSSVTDKWINDSNYISDKSNRHVSSSTTKSVVDQITCVVTEVEKEVKKIVLLRSS